MRTRLRRAALLLLLPATALAADVVLLDRIVAVVDLHAITKRSVDARARELAPPASDPATLTEARKQALTSLIEEHLIAEDAEKAGVSVDSEDVDRALEAVAQQNGLTVEQLFVEAKKQGLEKDVYRASVRRQLLEGKWLRLKSAQGTRPKDGVAQSDFMASERARLVAELKAKAAIEVRP
ncbi:MAG: SurA N-terminal domain-containing protein [Myxococcota bacterium]